MKNHSTLVLLCKRCAKIKNKNRKPLIKKRFTIFCSDPGGTQTHDLQNRNLTLYSTKLPSQRLRKSTYNILV